MTAKRNRPDASPAISVAHIYLRVSTDEQDRSRQTAIVDSTRLAGCYIAGIYREKASGARADRPELLRMIDDLQLGMVCINAFWQLEALVSC